jgi:hypothetical protein
MYTVLFPRAPSLDHKQLIYSGLSPTVSTRFFVQMYAKNIWMLHVYSLNLFTFFGGGGGGSTWKLIVGQIINNLYRGYWSILKNQLFD